MGSCGHAWAENKNPQKCGLAVSCFFFLLLLLRVFTSMKENIQRVQLRLETDLGIVEYGSDRPEFS